MDMDDMPCKRMLEAYESDAPDAIEPAEVHVRPRDDHRSLPPALRDLLLADTADELEVMEMDDDPYVARVCIFQMWRTMGNDELGSLSRSLG